MSIQQNINQLLTMTAAGAYLGKGAYEKGTTIQKELTEDYIADVVKSNKEKEEYLKTQPETEETKRRMELMDEYAGYPELAQEQLRGEALEARKTGGSVAERKLYKQRAQDVRENQKELHHSWMDTAKEQINTRQKHQELLKQLKEKDPGTYAIYGERALEWEGGK